MTIIQGVSYLSLLEQRFLFFLMLEYTRQGSVFLPQALLTKSLNFGNSYQMGENICGRKTARLLPVLCFSGIVSFECSVSASTYLPPSSCSRRVLSGAQPGGLVSGECVPCHEQRRPKQ
jgi:hypothetical protein